MQFLLSHCQIAFDQHGSIFLALFLAGLVGGTTHCAGMCGPFVIAQIKNNGECNSYMQKLSGAALLPYHFGRMTTYIMLGVVSVLLSKQIMGTPLQKWISFIFLNIAGLIFIISALPNSLRINKFIKFTILTKFSKFLENIVKKMLNNSEYINRYLLGVLLGFLPCGLVFASIMVVSTTGSIFSAILGMSLFTVGIFPSMLMIGLGGKFIYSKWPNFTNNAMRYVMIANGFSLFIIAAKLAL